MSMGYLNLNTTTAFNGDDEYISANALKDNLVQIQGWSANISGYVTALQDRINGLEKIIKWTAETYPEVIAGYKAVQDITKEKR